MGTTVSKSIPERIGRFKIVKELGRGSQGVVYLASDPQLDRNVAIKTIHLGPSRESRQKREVIIREAKTVSKLQHPNIITVYDAGESEEGPYVVYEYVDGVSLRDLVRSNGGLNVHQATKLMSQILEGISYAHEQGVVHRDISPSNILISRSGIPRIMDFGLSVKTAPDGSAPRNVSGTPCYMSPEHVSGKNIGPQSDIFSLGLVFYEMLTGKPAVRAENEYATMYRIANESLPPPSSANREIDEELDRIVLRAIARDPNSRYAAASEMRGDLEKYLNVEPTTENLKSAAEDSHVTLDFLLRRMKHKSDFPTFSQYIVEINQKASVKERNFTSASQLSNVIIKDLALTNKLLKLVNSAFYNTTGGQVTTVSRAVVILGFEQVRFAAASLMLFDHLQNKSQKVELQDSAASSFMSGLIAKDLSGRLRVSAEEAFICAMLHRLGRHLVIFYFPEEYEQIRRVMATKGVDDNSACRAVLGISYDEIGSGVAKAWKFPDKIVRSMQSAPRGRVERPTCEEDQLQALSAFSNELCHIVNTSEGEEGEKAIASLLKRFDESIPIPKEKVKGLLDSAMEKMKDYSEILNINVKKNRFLTRVGSYSKVEKTEAEKKTSPQTENMPDTQLLETLQVSELDSPSKDEDDPDTILLNGIQEIINTLLDEYEINDLMTMILETMYRGFRFHHVLLCLLDMKKLNVAARFGFGENMDKIIEKFHFQVNPKSPDIFNLALSQEKDLGIENANDPRIRKGLPEWYLKAVSAPAFILCPIVVNGASVGLVYADRSATGKVITGNQIKYMKTLCNQAVLAMKQLRRRS